MARDVCYFDGACGLCQRSRRVLSALDWLGRLEFVDFTSLPPERLPVPIEAAMTGMPMRTADGRVLIGYAAVRRALRRTPLGFVPGLLMYVPGIAWVGARVYGWIARNRQRGAVCRLPGDRGADVSARHGFSLVELLVVIAVVATLAAVLLPTMAGARASARAVQCASNLRQAFVVMRAYADDYRGKSPALGQPYARVPNWALVVQQSSGRTGTTGTELYSAGTVLVCPSVRALYSPGMERTYAVNVTGHAGQAGDPDNYDTGAVYIALDKLPRPSEAVILVDSLAAATTTDGPPPTRTASVLDFRQPAHVRERLGRVHGLRPPTRFNGVFGDGSAGLRAEPEPGWLVGLP